MDKRKTILYTDERCDSEGRVMPSELKPRGWAYDVLRSVAAEVYAHDRPGGQPTVYESSYFWVPNDRQVRENFLWLIKKYPSEVTDILNEYGRHYSQGLFGFKQLPNSITLHGISTVFTVQQTGQRVIPLRPLYVGFTSQARIVMYKRA